MIETLTDFINNSHAEKSGRNLWTVYADGDNKRGIIRDCFGKNEFQAKENAWHYIQEIKRALNK